jgi:hypothetical protein
MATYKAVTLDGQEHPYRDQWTLKQWYFARLIGPESPVLSTELVEWTQLKNVFDLPQWEAEERQSRGLGPNDSVFKVASTPEPPPRVPDAKFQTPYKYDRDNERGLRAAGILMFINAALTLASLVLLALKPNSSVSSFWGFAILLDLIVGYKLLTSDNAGLWQKIALVRVCLGAFLIGLILLLIGPDALIKLMGLLDIVFGLSFFLLLVGHASRARVTAGVLTFVISTCGVVGLLTLMSLSGGARAKLEIKKHALPHNSFFDPASGGRMHLPEGWVLLRPDNPIVPRPYATMIAVHPDSSSYATLLIQQDRWGSSLDTSLSTMVADQRQRQPGTVELERVDSLFGRLEGRRVALTWQEQGKEFKGWVSVVRNGSYLIYLNEWCAAETYAKSAPQFEALEHGASAAEPQPDSWGTFPRRK